MKTLWVTDAWDTLDHRRDTTLRLVQESLAIGHEAWWCETAGLRFDRGRVVARCRRVLAAPPERDAAGWTLGPPELPGVDGFDAVHYRTDPPVDTRYWEYLHLLAWAAGPGGPEIVNPPSALLRWGDKLGPRALEGALPPTVVSSDWEALRAFGAAEGRTVLKPLGGAQSRGVQLLDWTSAAGAEHARGSIASLSDRFARPVLLQRFLPAVYEGEKRLWFVDGALLACCRKRPQPGSFVVDMDKGSPCDRCDLDAGERRLADAVGEALRAERVRLAAVDVVGGHVTDWNLTSPGMIPTMERVLDRNLARPIVETLARR